MQTFCLVDCTLGTETELSLRFELKVIHISSQYEREVSGDFPGVQAKQDHTAYTYAGGGLQDQMEIMVSLVASLFLTNIVIHLPECYTFIA